MDIHEAWDNGYEMGKFEEYAELTNGHKDIHPKGIIYCKDCDYSFIYESPKNYIKPLRCKFNYLKQELREEDFCSYGKIKE